MKPWEETWTLHHPTIHAGRDVVFEVIHDGEGRGQLAAQAPAMARLLMLMAREPVPGEGTGPVVLSDMDIAAIRLVLRAAGVTS